MTNFTDRVYLRLNDSAPEFSDPFDIVRKIWWFQDGKWALGGFKDDRVDIESYLTLAEYSGEPTPEPANINLFEITSNDEPLMVIDRGFIVQKDISAGGFVGSNQGAMFLGSGFTSQVDTPKIILSNSSVSRLQGGGPLNIPAVPSYSNYPGSPVKGQVFILTTNQHLYEYNGSGWDDKGPTSDFAGYFDTLYLTKADGSTPAYMNLGKLKIGDDVNLYRGGTSLLQTDSFVKINNTGAKITFYDIDLYRQTSPLVCLELDDDMIIDGALQVGSGLSVTGVIGATGTITTNGDVTINKATPILQLKATSGDPIIEFYDTSTLKMNLAYSAAGDYFYLRDIVGSKDVFQATHAGQLALPVNGSTGGLRIGDDAYLYRGSTNTLYVYRNIEPGADTETGYLGEGERYWYGLVSKYVYYKYIYEFYDEYDDLSIAKLWGEKNQTLPDDYDATKLKPPTDDPFKIIKGSKDEANTEEFFDVGKVNGFLMGCVKALAKKQDEHDALLLKLLNEVESLRAEIAS